MATLVTTYGVDDALLDAPPLVAPPLSLPDLCIELVDLEGLTAQHSEALEKASSAQSELSEIVDRMSGQDQSDLVLAQLQAEYDRISDTLADWQQQALTAEKELARLQRWEYGFRYLPELGLSATETWAPDTVVAQANLAAAATNTKNVGSNQGPVAWYDPFVAIGRDSRSVFGYSPSTDISERALRALRALRAYEAFQCEHEFWTGSKIPTNFHLSASPNTPLTSPHRVITAWSNPTPASGTTLGVSVGLTGSLAALDQSIADASAGVGMIHATPFVVQEWSRTYPFIRDNQGRNLTVNGNIIVPGYGYPGTGPDTAARTITDGATTSGSPNLTSTSAAFTTLDIGSTVGLAGLATPAISSTSTLTTGGTLAPATYGYRVSALDATGETLASSEATQVVPAGTSTNTVTVNWGAVSEATGYRIYGRTPSGEQLLATLGAVTTYTDTGSATPSGALPTSNTTASTATGIPAGAYIIAVTSATVAVMNVNADATGSALTVTLGAGTGSLAGQRYQWAYATEMLYTMRGDPRTYPWDLRQASPSVPQFNSLDVRAERSWAVIGNQLLRAAVMVDTQTA